MREILQNLSWTSVKIIVNMINSDKRFMRFGSSQHLANIKSNSVSLNGVHIPASTEVTCLSVRLDSLLSFSPTSNIWLTVVLATYKQANLYWYLAARSGLPGGL